ncbi:MAG: hypothetical protein KatS3mg102_0210 [Planctomycetota bacterium]|nr:MAG: hypothetical protein KatS3mg102_0210 [Planctomycetota bacterium]
MAQDAQATKMRVRGTWVRHGLDADRLSVTISRDVLTVRGEVRYLPARARVQGEVNAEVLARIEQELRTFPEIKHIRWQLDNWRRESGGWYPTAGQRRRQPRKGKG